MEKKRIDFSSVATSAGKNAANIFNKAKDKAVQIMDQNDDGKFDIKDVTHIADAVSDAAKKTAENVKKAADEKARELELKALMPIFETMLDDAEFSLTKLIRICEEDKRHAESEVCRGAIGYFTDRDLRVVNIYRKNLDKFGITLFPDAGSEFYYVDPSDRDCYIALDDYFGQMKIARITELQKIAQDLGARHFKVTYKEERASIVTKDIKGSAKVSGVASGDGEKNMSSSNYSAVEIAAEMTCPGHAPQKPYLKYLKRDAGIENLIAMRLDTSSPLSHQKFSIKMSNSSGIKESDAVKIDAILKYYKVAGNVSLTSEAQSEARRYLDYEIDF